MIFRGLYEFCSCSMLASSRVSFVCDVSIAMVCLLSVSDFPRLQNGEADATRAQRRCPKEYTLALWSSDGNERMRERVNRPVSRSERCLSMATSNVASCVPGCSRLLGSLEVQYISRWTQVQMRRTVLDIDVKVGGRRSVVSTSSAVQCRAQSWPNSDASTKPHKTMLHPSFQQTAKLLRIQIMNSSSHLSTCSTATTRRRRRGRC